MKDARGNKLYRNVDIKIVYPDGRKEKLPIRVTPRSAFSAETFETMIEDIIERLDNQFPYWDFRLVSRGPAAATFVYDGLRQERIAKEYAEKAGALSTPILATPA